MKEKYIKFYETFDKRFKNNKNLILCSKTLSNGRADLNREFSQVLYSWIYIKKKIYLN